MNEQIKQDWIAALLSGDYTQGQERLRDGDRYCCLGVLCDLYVKSHNDLRWDANEIVDNDNLFVEDVTLPSQVVRWAGLEEYGRGVFVEKANEELKKEQLSLAVMNDGGFSIKPHSFKEIAAVIEEKL